MQQVIENYEQMQVTDASRIQHAENGLIKAVRHYLQFEELHKALAEAMPNYYVEPVLVPYDPVVHYRDVEAQDGRVVLDEDVNFNNLYQYVRYNDTEQNVNERVTVNMLDSAEERQRKRTDCSMLYIDFTPLSEEEKNLRSMIEERDKREAGRKQGRRPLETSDQSLKELINESNPSYTPYRQKPIKSQKHCTLKHWVTF